ncbi:ABC transporter substrate-binding protein [Paenibacillus sp. 1P07SE]|uniref:ABC transporter substrate-binding protein n=1 Tax=Paenibacillus sp. 1P07SE TaxID=3132209 RepID=UPI0039A659B6
MFNRQKPTKGTKLRALLAVTLMSSLLAACGGDNGNSHVNGNNDGNGNSGGETAQELVLTDAAGVEVTIPAGPQRVLASYLEDYLIALDVKPVAQWSVANGTLAYLSDELDGIPPIPYDLPLEVVNEMAPDFIILGDDTQAAEGKQTELAKIAPTYLLGSETVKDWRQALTKIGELLQREEQAAAVLEAYDMQVAEAKAAIDAAAPGESAAILWLVSQTFYLVDETVASGAVLYGDLGLRPPNLVTDIPVENRASWNPISLEALAGMDADHIFLINSDGADPEGLDTPIWDNLPAVQAGNVYEFTRETSWLYSGPIASQQTLSDTVERLAP